MPTSSTKNLDADSLDGDLATMRNVSIRRAAHRILILSIVSSLASCSSLIERCSPPPAKIFPGVRLDYSIASLDGGHWDGPGSLPFRCVWAVIDAPFSLAMDTVLLPWDAVMVWEASAASERASQSGTYSSGMSGSSMSSSGTSSWATSRGAKAAEPTTSRSN